MALSSKTDLSTLVSHASITSESVYSNFSPKRLDNAICTNQLTFSNLDNSWKRVSDFEWATTKAPGSAIADFNVPFGLVKGANVASQMAALWQRFVYHSYSSVDVALVVTGAPAQTGLAYAYFRPAPEATAATPSHPMALEVCQRIVPHVSSTYKIRIPWFYHKSFISSASNSEDASVRCGVFTISVGSQLVTDQKSVYMTMYVRFNDHDYRVPRPSVNSAYPSLNGPIANVAQVIGQVVDEVSNNAVVKTVDSLIGSVFNMDRPHVGGNTLMVQTSVPSMSNLEGPRSSYSMQAKYEGTRKETVRSAASVDSFSSLCARRHLLTTLTYKDSSTQGEQLVQIPLTFMPVAYLKAAGAATSFNITPIEYLADQFSLYWGDITYEFCVIANNFHSGVLRAGYYYDVGESIKYSDLETTFNTVMDISNGNHSFVLTVPANAAQEFLRPPPCAVVPSADRVVFNGSAISDYIYGYLSLFVVNPLRCLSEGSTSVEIQVYMSVKPRFVEPRALTTYGNRSGNNSASIQLFTVAPTVSLVEEHSVSSSHPVTYIMPHPELNLKQNSDVTARLRRSVVTRTDRNGLGLIDSDEDFAVLNGPVGVSSVATAGQTHASGEVGMQDDNLPISESVASECNDDPSITPQVSGKFTYEVKTFSSLWTRYRPIKPQSTVFRWTNATGTNLSTNLASTTYIFETSHRYFPLHEFFWGFKGGFNLRFVIGSDANARGVARIMFVPSFRYDGQEPLFQYKSYGAGVPTVSIDLGVLPMLNSVAPYGEQIYLSPDNAVTTDPSPRPATRISYKSQQLESAPAIEIIPLVGGAQSIDIFCPMIAPYHLLRRSVGKVYVEVPGRTTLLASYISVGDDFEPVGYTAGVAERPAYHLALDIPEDPAITDRVLHFGSTSIPTKS